MTTYGTGLSKDQAPSVMLAVMDGIIVVSVTTGATVHVDLSTSFGSTYNKRFLSIIAAEDMAYHVSDGATDTVSASATAGSTRGDLIPASVRHEGYAPGRYLHLIAVSATGLVRIHLSSP